VSDRANTDDRWGFPRLNRAEWLTFSVLSGLLSLTTLYTTLLTSWGDGGAILSVLASVIVLRAITGKVPSLYSVNLGQTMASAGGYMGCAVAPYAALVLCDPSYRAEPVPLLLLFLGAGLYGTAIGASLRRVMIGYTFPTGTACAVIQKSVVGTTDRRPTTLLLIWGVVGAVLAIPVKIARASGHALLPPLALGWKGLTIAVDPILYGIGLVVGPRIGIGLLIGGTFAHLGLPPLLETLSVESAQADQWIGWLAISLLVLPSVASIIGSRLWPAVAEPHGFEPGKTSYPPAKNGVIQLLGAGGGMVAVLAAVSMFQLPLWIAAAGLLLTVPVCLMNGRVTGDTDVNPLMLVAALMMFTFFFAMPAGRGLLICLAGLAVLCGAVTTMAVDSMYDYRTGYLLDQDPRPQTWIQLLGVIIGSLAAVPFVLLLQTRYGFGGAGLPSAGPRVYSDLAKNLVNAGDAMSGPLLWMVVSVSVFGCLYALLSSWPKLARWMPSLFGVGIGMLLGFAASTAIFIGSLIKVGATLAYKKGDAEKDTMLAGSALFTGGAIISVLLILLSALLEAFGLPSFDLPTH
jgi:uncharacterized oligopeptide transporter (OPT) family protein